MKSIAELEKMCEIEAKNLRLRLETNYEYIIIVSSSTHSLMKGARDTINAMIEELSKLDKSVLIKQDGHLSPSDVDPIVEVYRGDVKTTYQLVDSVKGREIIQRHIMNNEIIHEYVLEKED